jgi:1,4-alpha-glucan branching enzyme
VANFTPIPRDGYRIGLPGAGRWEVVLDTNATFFGGTGYAGSAEVHTEDVAWHGLDQSACLALPPLAVVWLAHRG